MNWMGDELLFTGGIAVMVLSLLAAIVYFVVSRRGKKRLNERLDAEYGEKGRGK